MALIEDVSAVTVRDVFGVASEADTETEVDPSIGLHRAGVHP
jgi:hypothetical protein